MTRPGRIVLAGGLAALAFALLIALAFYLIPAPPPVVALRDISYADLKGWQSDDHPAALSAFRRSCERSRTPPSMRAAPELLAAWQTACAAAKTLPDNDAAAARRFFERQFRPRLLTLGREDKGLLTGYYEPELAGSLTPDPGYDTPLYRLPDDLLTADLGAFAADLAGRRIVGRVAEGRFVPYLNRAEIAAGGLAGRGLEILWVKDPIAAFVLEIQGSGRVRLPDGSLLRIGYAGKNGRAYTAIGRTLVQEGAMTLEAVNMPAIRRWLEDHPEERQRVFNSNASYVFFRLLEEDGPIGSEGVVLTPERSLAVDPKYVPLGLPVWIESELPAAAGGGALDRLLVAQDTGGAITGALRGDVFWGPGERAEVIAGHMRQPARFVVLTPKGAP